MILWLSACGQSADTALTVIEIQEATYQVQWSPLMDSRVGVDGLATITRFDVVLYSMRLPECLNTASQSFGFNSAWAGHSDINIPSDWQQPQVLSLVTDGTVEHTQSFPSQRLCHVGVTYARWDGATLNVPNTTEEPYSILLEGVCDVGEEQIPFRLQTKIPSERIMDTFDEDLMESKNGLRVTIGLRPDSALEDLDCHQISSWDDTVPLQVLTNLQTTSLWSMEQYDVR